MKKNVVSLILLFLAAASPAVAQKRKKPQQATPIPTITLAEAISQYRFDEAEELLLDEIENLKSKGLSTNEAENKLHAVEKAQSRLNATEQVVFIDSLVVPKAELFKHLRMSDEVGSVSSYSSYFNTPEAEDLSVFLSQMKDKIYYSEKDRNGHIRLFSKDLEGGQWSEPTPLSGLEELGNTHQNYPFVLSDGITLYYAAQGSESIGGYDIFMTRYDTDEHTFLTPENIGMPFNSPANDYLYMVDDFLNLGWFVTDRYQSADKVCIYTFIPNQTRRVYNTANLSPARLRSLARIGSIHDTWQNNKEEVNKALERVAMLNQQNQDLSPDTDLQFVISDGVIYHSLTDFQNPDARKSYEFLKEGNRQREELEHSLEESRLQYAKANESDKASLKGKILQGEQQLRKLIQDLHHQEKEIRRLETVKK